MQRIVSALAALAVLFPARIVFAHIHIEDPPPINDVTQLKNAPCGCLFNDATAQGCDPAFTVTPVPASGEVSVTWKETVLHPGNFRIAASTKAPDQATAADFDAGVLMEFADQNETANADISQTVTLPPGTQVVQVRQEMTDNPADPYYFSCAAVALMAPTTTSASTGTGATTSTSAATTSVAVAASSGSGSPVYEPEPNDDGCAVHAGAPLDESGWAFGLAVAGALGFLAFRRRRS